MISAALLSFSWSIYADDAVGDADFVCIKKVFNDGFYDLSPAYDVVPSVQGLGQQQMRVGKSQAESSLENALSEVQAFGLSKDAAVASIRRVVATVDQWKESFTAHGVSARDLDRMAQYIDGAWLKAQRLEFGG